MPRPVDLSAVPKSKASSASQSSSSGAGSSLVSRSSAALSAGKTTPSGIGDCVFLEEERQQSIGMLYGGPGSGKSYFSLRYMPKPAMLINCDGRARKVVREMHTMFPRQIHFVEVPYNTKHLSQMSREEAQKIGQDAMSFAAHNYGAGLEAALKGNLRSIIWDTGTELSDLISLAMRGRLGVKESDYGASKNLIALQWWSIFQSARETSVNLLILSRQTSVWVDNQSVKDSFEPKIIDTAEDGVDWIAGIKMKVRNKKISPVLNMYNAKINPAERYQIYTSEHWGEDGNPYAYMNSVLYRGSSEEDWK